MKTIIINLYEFKELSKEVQEKVIQDNWNINVEYSNWWEGVYEDSQRIGLKLTGFNLDYNTIEGEFLLSPIEVSQNIINEHGENCNTFKLSLDFQEQWQPIFNDYMNEESANYESRELEIKMQSLEDNYLKSLLKEYLKMLNNEYEYLTTKEAIINSLDGNTFEQSGKIRNI